MTKSNPSNTNSLRREKSSKAAQKAPETSCNCLGKKTKRKGRAFLTGFATNLGICIVLFGYTLLGSVIFLSIEGEYQLKISDQKYFFHRQLSTILIQIAYTINGDNDSAFASFYIGNIFIWP